MKKWIIAGVCFLLMMAPITRAQPMPVLTQINIRSVRSFIHDYPGAADVDWTVLKEGGALCRFVLNGVPCRAFYSARGVWTGTVSSYDEKHLNGKVRNIVKRVYYDYAIIHVDEVNLPATDPVYIIQVQDEKELKVLRVSEEQMEVIQELKRG